MIIEKKDYNRFDKNNAPKAMEPLLDDMQSLCEKRNLYRAAIKEVSTKLEILDDEFQVKHDYNPIHHIESRVKTLESTLEKIIRREFPADLDSFDKIMDVAGIRVICKYSCDVYRIAELLTSQSDVELIADKDYIKYPKESGYRSYHIAVTVPVFLSDKVEKVPVEIQIRTIMMDTWASIEHELKYKNPDKKLPIEAERNLQLCAEEMNEIDKILENIHLSNQ